MNAQEMLDYSFGLLDDPTRERFERELARDPDLADRVTRLGRAIQLLVDDGETYEPPADLAARTITFVAEWRRRRGLLDLVPARVPFRWADVAVAASIFLAGLLTLLPAVQSTRARAAQAGCLFNLQQLGVALNQYAGTHGTFPYAAPDSSAPYAGTFGVLLNDSGYLRHAAVLNCPCDKRDRVPDRLPDFRTLCLDESRAPKSSPCLRNVDYAYNLGYRQDGRPVPISIAAPISTPLLADRPPCTKNHCKVLDGNSPNHGGLGQNVLYTGGHVRWHPTRRLGPHDDDMFLNAEHHLAPGLHEQDAVLGPGFARFDAR